MSAPFQHTESQANPKRDLYLVFDTEANGFYEDGTIVWCFCAKDMRTGQRWEWGGPEGVFKDRDEIRALIRRAHLIACHNQIKHDLPQLYKLKIVSPKDWEGAKVIDTFVLSSLLNPDRPNVMGVQGAHGLEAWGVRAGRLKPEQEQWLEWDPNMLHRCREDVEINEWAFKALQKESRQDDWFWKTAIDVEHKQAFIIAEQERNGWHFYKDRAQELIDFLDTEIEAIDEKIVPLMPPKFSPTTPLKSLFIKNGNYHSAVCKWFGVEPESATGDDPILGPSPIEHPRYFVKAIDGTIRKATKEEIAAWPEKKVGLINRAEEEAPNPGSDDQIKEFLLTQGWMPDEYTPTGGPKFTETSLGSIQSDSGKLVAKRKVYAARRGQLENSKNPEEKGWMAAIRPDGRVPAVCNPCGCNTGRARHKIIVNVPRVTSDFGREMRSVFGVPEGHFQLGYDASGLELRCLAHYMEDPEYIRILLNEDIHTYNQTMAGLETRDQAKTFIYALIYGAGDLKIGRIVGGNSTQGKELRYKFFSAIPALDRLLTTTKTVAKRGFLRGIDGRKLMVRSDHSALNTLLQSAGAIVMKYSMIILDDWYVAEGYKHPASSLADIYCGPQPVMKVGDIHDESQLQIREELVTGHETLTDSESETFKASEKKAGLWLPDDRIWSAPHLVEGDKKEGPWTWERHYARPGELAVLAVREAGNTLRFNCPLDAEYKIGKSWAETH